MGKRDARNSMKMKRRRSQVNKLARDKRQLLAAQQAGKVAAPAAPKKATKKEKAAPAPAEPPAEASEPRNPERSEG
jgi:hypothetical protein